MSIIIGGLVLIATLVAAFAFGCLLGSLIFMDDDE